MAAATGVGAMAAMVVGLVGLSLLESRHLEEVMSDDEAWAGVERYLEALRDGDLAAAWEEACPIDAEDDRFREWFHRYHRSGVPRPDSWEIRREPSPDEQRDVGDPAGVVVVRFEDGFEGVADPDFSRVGGLCAWSALRGERESEGARRLAIRSTDGRYLGSAGSRGLTSSRRSW